MLRKIQQKMSTLVKRKGLAAFSHMRQLVVDQPHVRRKSRDGLVQFRAGRLPKIGSVAKEFTAEHETQKILDAVVDCLKAAKIEYFVVPNATRTKYRVGLLASDRQKFFTQLSRRHSDTGMYIATMDGLHRRQIISSRRSLHAFRQANTVHIYSFTLSPSHDMLAGEENGCSVDFWESTENKDRRQYLSDRLKQLRVNIPLDALVHTLIAPTKNDFTGILPLGEVKPATIAVGGKKYRTYDIFTRKSIEDIDFPIDIVYAWVDDSDPKWQAKFNKYRSVVKDVSDRNNTESRYRDRQELKYSLRSIHMFAPWVRNIYIVTDGQTPDWLDTSVKGVKIVDHKDIFADAKALPVFNSHAIGAQLHHIKGLSDRYLYLNDDVMFGRAISPQAFFYGSGIAKLAISPAQIHAGKPNDYEPAPSSAGKNVRKALEGTFNRTITNKFKHTPSPQIKEVAYELEEKYPDLVRRTTTSRFRSKTDIQFAGLLHHSYSLLTGRAVTSDMEVAVVNISQSGAQEALDRLVKTHSAYTICLNESETPKDKQDEIGLMVQEFFERYYPYPSPWEKDRANDNA